MGTEQQTNGARAGQTLTGPAPFKPEPNPSFVSSPDIGRVVDRSLAYLEIGYPVHFAGFAGTGKTTMAMHLAAMRGRPALLMHGNDEVSGSDLVGRQGGYSRSTLVDNYIRSVVRSEEQMRLAWSDSALTVACREGYTFIYDEFNRSRAEANNILLSVLEEGILSMPLFRNQRGFLEVHPEFRAIFTSNPEEYAGAHRSADALLDRMITIHVGHYDRETEISITTARGLPRGEAEIVVDIVRAMRALDPNQRRPSVRASIAIASMLVRRGAHACADDEFFRWVCHDMINMGLAQVLRHGQRISTDKLDETIDRVCAGEKFPESFDHDHFENVSISPEAARTSKQLRRELEELRALAAAPMNHGSRPSQRLGNTESER
jgi:nitric oxide reductase NorQ protein